MLPDGRMEIVFHLGDPPRVGGWIQPRAVVAGQIESALELSPNGAVDAIGVRLRPESGGGLFPAAELRGGVYELDALTGSRRANEALERIGNANGRHAALHAVLASWSTGWRQPDPLIGASIAAIERSAGRGPLERFAPESPGLRQWERRFISAAGIGPKAFARIARLREAIRLHESGNWQGWAAIAIECGFYDQAHMANDFRAFSGSSPSRFFRESRALAEFYRAGNFQDGTASAR